MGIFQTLRPANAKGQFILPAIPASASPELVLLIEEYRTGFMATAESDHPRWGAAAAAIHAFTPRSTADLAAKLIMAIHYRDPECDGSALVIEAPEPVADRLAVEMELGCLDWLLAQIRPPLESSGAWAAAEEAFAEADADLDALPTPYTDEECDRLADIRSDAIDALLALPATNIAQALRKLELAMFDGTMVRTGVDFPNLLAEAQRLVSTPEAVIPDPVAEAWQAYKDAYSRFPDEEGEAFEAVTDTADDVLGNHPTTTMRGVAGKLRRVFITHSHELWAQKLALGEEAPENRRQLERSDLYTRMLWSAVEDVERIAEQEKRA